MFLVPNIYTILILRQWRINLKLKNVVNFNYFGLIEVNSTVKSSSDLFGKILQIGHIVWENFLKG